MRTACSLAVLAALAACDRPQPGIVCHNANCINPDITRDDTPEAMRNSFALDVLDGMEWDTFWYAATNTCLFAHDLDHDTTIPARVAAEIVAENLAAEPRPFTIIIDVKPHVGSSFDDRHTPEQLAAHVACALESAELVADAAAGQPLTIAFNSAGPELLAALSVDPRYAALGQRPAVETMLVADIFAPYADIVPRFSDFTVPLDGIEYHPDFLTRPEYELYTSYGLDLIQWSFVATPEAFDAIERYDPRFVITNEAVLMRRWEDY